MSRTSAIDDPACAGGTGLLTRPRRGRGGLSKLLWQVTAVMAMASPLVVSMTAAAPAADAERPKVQLHPMLRTPPGPDTPVFYDLPSRRTVPFAQWLRLWGSATEGTSSHPSKTAPFDGGAGNGSWDSQTGKLSGSAVDQGAGVRKTAEVYWDFTFRGTQHLDIDLTATTTPLVADCRAGPNQSNPMCGGGFSSATVYVTAVDRTTGDQLIRMIQREAFGCAGPFPVVSSNALDNWMPVRLEPGHEYRFGVRLEVTAAAYSDPGPKAARGSAMATGSVQVLGLALMPTHGPRVEVSIVSIPPGVYDTYDRYEQALTTLTRQEYFPGHMELHCFFGGQYATTDSSLRITLTGNGRISLYQPLTSGAGGFTQRRISDREILITPPPPIGNSLRGFHYYPVIRMNMEIEPDLRRNHVPTDVMTGPLVRAWQRIKAASPERPRVTTPTNRVLRMYDLANWYVLAPEAQVTPIMTRHAAVLAKPMPVLWAGPSVEGRAASPPRVAGCAVRAGSWTELASPPVKAYNQPVLALNLAAISDLQAVDLSSLTLSAEATGGRTPIQTAQGTVNRRDDSQTPPLSVLTRQAGYSTAALPARQRLLDELNTAIADWIRNLAVAVEDRPLLIVYVEEDGKVVTGKDLLQELGETEALAAMTAAYRMGVDPSSLSIEFKHYKLYSETAQIKVKGMAANGPQFRAVAEDASGLRTFFDFVPHPPDNIAPLSVAVE